MKIAENKSERSLSGISSSTRAVLLRTALPVVCLEIWVREMLQKEPLGLDACSSLVCLCPSEWWSTVFCFCVLRAQSAAGLLVGQGCLSAGLALQ